MPVGAVDRAAPYPGGFCTKWVGDEGGVVCSAATLLARTKNFTAMPANGSGEGPQGAVVWANKFAAGKGEQVAG